ncbi:MAG TPA: FAD-binding oxidoreductase [Firmicutes bacterium]|nr:FAD-binding oxidoreductase [Bacillota bacterium]HBL48931.1 FAD-binding oxidoreductase [Bacillota bacterium]HCT36932.1 FAD-binding oxidoreductase [Bacillota bacterium]
MAKNKWFQPDWYERIPNEKSYRAILKWGALDRFKHPNKRLVRLMMDTFHMTEADFAQKRELGEEIVDIDVPSRLTPQQIDALSGIVGDENVKIDGFARLEVAYGKTMVDLIRLRKKVIENLPDAVVLPRDKQDVQALVKYCSAEKIPITVYGGGSTVMRGVECTRGGISLDVRAHMNRVLKLNPVNQTVTVEPGIFGPALEKALNEAPERFGTKLRYTSGYFPQSIESSTVGGWVVTRGCGQNSTYYGKIEHIVVCQEYITPVGEIATREYPAKAIGPDIDQIMIGSEGAYGILVSATLRICRYMPQNTKRFSFIFKDWHSAIEATREMMQLEFGRPSVFRLSDPEETDVALKLYGVEGTAIDTAMRLRGYKAGERCLLLGTADGERGFTSHVKHMIKKVARKYGAMYATGYVTKAWEHGRFEDPYLREDLQDYGILIDTLECAVSWDQIEETWHFVKEYCHRRPDTIIMSHSSHFYPQGTNLYFIFIAKMDSIEEFVEYQSGIIDHINKAGAALSHHHGIGKMLAPWYENSVGSNQLAVLRALKKHFDPDNMMNPGGTLALDEIAAPAGAGTGAGTGQSSPTN